MSLASSASHSISRDTTYCPLGKLRIDDFKGAVPAFLPELLFVGSLERWAVLESLIGGLQRRATITAHGKLEEDSDTVLFTETYEFDDGNSDTLHWTIRKVGNGQYTGHEILEGEATGE